MYLNAQSRTVEGLRKAEKVEIEEERKHELYLDGIYAYDVMLIKLKSGSSRSSSSSSAAQKRQWISINQNVSLPQPNDELFVLGYGGMDEKQEEEDSIVISNSLRQVTVNAVDYQYCWAMYRAAAVALSDAGIVAQELTPDQLCAESMNTGACTGDSGGPLFIKGDEDSVDVLVGTIAWHRGGCGNNFFPDVFSNVSWFAAWIVKNACDMSNHPSHFSCPQ